jgi:sigma-B regulation protein RsbU (phosphoserine phosphatase)
VTANEPRIVDYNRLIKNVEHLVEAIEDADDVAATVHMVADAAISQFRDPLGLYGGRIYRREGDEFVLQGTFGEAKEVPVGLRVPADYGPIRELIQKRTLYMEENDPLLDRELEAHLGVQQFVAIEVGDKDYILSFNVAPGYDKSSILFSLSILRHSINQKIRQERMVDALRDARRIQASILPRGNPEFAGFDICGRSIPLERVGGDHFDFISMTDKIMGLAIADVSGHGLPAALQVRDIYMGLRMGLSRDYKIVRVVERLNEIIHLSTLTSRFVSMVYGELEASGNFVYVNCGHPPPFRLAADGKEKLLERGGIVLGPIPDATYERGFVKIRPGDLLVLYTDGIVEGMGREAGGQAEEFGLERLIEVARENRHGSAKDVIQAILDRLEVFSSGAAAEDDQTLVVVKRPLDESE